MKRALGCLLLMGWLMLSGLPGAEPDREAFMHDLVGFHWTWINKVAVPGEKSVEGLTFHHDGRVVNEKYWTGHWDVVGPRMLVLTLEGQRAYLVFNAEHSHYVGFDFNGVTTVSGNRGEHRP